MYVQRYFKQRALSLTRLTPSNKKQINLTREKNTVNDMKQTLVD